jgi:hypothetical protein
MESIGEHIPSHWVKLISEESAVEAARLLADIAADEFVPESHRLAARSWCARWARLVDTERRG